MNGCDCTERAEGMGVDLRWFCWMFGCDVCADAKTNCGDVANGEACPDCLEEAW